MIAMRVTEESKLILNLMTEEVVHELEGEYTYAVFDELGREPMRIIGVKEFRQLQLNFDMQHHMITAWTTV